MREKQSSGHRWLASLVIALGLPMAGGTLHAASDAGEATAKSKITNKAYIVQLAEQPVSAYTGGIRGYGATRPNKGQKIDPNAPKVVSYMSYLASRHDTVLGSVGANKKHYSYGYVFNGFAADLTEAQAQKLAETPGVLAVSKDELLSLDTATTPAFLGLSGPTGFWNRTGATGENVIIGIVDTGAWPEHPSFSDRTGTNGNGTVDGKLSYQQIPGWNGKCTPGEAFNASHCNQKLIGARYYNSGFGGNAGIDAQFPFDYNSPRDWDSHGTHTATTAGGNADVQTTGAAAVFGKVSGMAPRARIAAYKVCWGGADGGCFGSDSVAAIDQAVADGVDVINFSISGTSTNFRDPVEIAFLFAADAGVFVAASAGNSGPNSSTVAHPSPWLTTVAAATHNRDGAGSTTLGNAVTYSGASMATLGGVGPVPLIDSTAAGLAVANATAVALCFSAADNGGVAVLDPAKVTGKIVLCDRGTNARVSKSQAVKEAGGVGMILVNTSLNSLNADLHAVPSVHLSHTNRAAVKAYAATATPTATINQATVVLTAPAPFIAAFSSRGPLRGANGDLLKPDIAAPGQDILAGVSPASSGGALFDLLSGTSMSSPHIAGIAALFKQAKPDWSPMAIKSAMMTTGSDVLDGGTPAPNTNPVLIFRQGAGHVQPNNALTPGLVFDSNFGDWLGFLCGTQLPVSFCTDAGVPVLDPSNMNVASIAIGDMAGTQTVTRRVTNVGGSAATYTASYTGMLGFTVVISPSTLTLAAGETKSFNVTFTRTTAPLNAYTGGQLRLTAGTLTVRVPMVVRPVALAAPTQVSGSFSVTFGYTGAFTASARGLVPATTDNTGSVATNGFVDFPVAIPIGTSIARFSLFDTHVSQPSDLDLEVRNPLGTLIAASGGATTAEEVNLLNPAAGTYSVRVVGFAVPVGSAGFTLFNWLVGTTAAGNMTLTAPASASIGTTGNIGITTSGLAVGTKYMGTIAFGGAAGMPNPTVVRIDP